MALLHACSGLQLTTASHQALGHVSPSAAALPQHSSPSTPSPPRSFPSTHGPAQTHSTAVSRHSHCLGCYYFPQGVSFLALFPEVAALSSPLLSLFSPHPQSTRLTLPSLAGSSSAQAFLTKAWLSHSHLFSPHFVPKLGHSSCPYPSSPFPWLVSQPQHQERQRQGRAGRSSRAGVVPCQGPAKGDPGMGSTLAEGLLGPWAEGWMETLGEAGQGHQGHSCSQGSHAALPPAPG